MTWRSESIPPVPDATAAAVKAAFPKGNVYVDLHEEFGSIYRDDLFADFYANRGHPIEVAPWQTPPRPPGSSQLLVMGICPLGFPIQIVTSPMPISVRIATQFGCARLVRDIRRHGTVHIASG